MSMMMRVTGSAAALCAGVVMIGCAHGYTADKSADAVAVAVADQQVADYSKPGFYVQLDERDGRLWVFAEGSEDLAKFKAEGRPARHVLRPGAGPDGLTLKSTESSTIIQYVASKPGFYVELDKDERLWVFEDGSEALAEFKEKGKPARHVVRPAAGPLGLTIKAVEFDVLDAYQAAK